MAFIPSVFFAHSAYAGLVMEQVVYEQGTQDKQYMTLYVQDNKLKQVEKIGQASPAVIFDLDAESVIFVNEGKKIYILLTREEYLKSLEPIMSEGKKSARENRDVVLKKTDEKQTIAGYESVKYEIYENGKLQTEYWVSDGLGFDDEVDFNKMSALMNDVKKTSQNVGGAASITDEEYDITRELYKSGYPLKTVHHSPDNGAALVEEIVSVRKENLPASEFIPPPGYQKITYKDLEKR